MYIVPQTIVMCRNQTSEYKYLIMTKTCKLQFSVRYCRRPNFLCVMLMDSAAENMYICFSLVWIIWHCDVVCSQWYIYIYTYTNATAYVLDNYCVWYILL
jgi:hypothetical protein